MIVESSVVNVYQNEILQISFQINGNLCSKKLC